VKRIAVIVALAAQATVARAHDFWIEPSTFRPASGQMVTASLRVGQEFIGDPVPRSSQLFESFTFRQASGERDVVGMENRDPAGYLRIDSPGLTMIGYRSKANPLALDAAKFESFLKLEGLERISALRAQKHETEKPDRENFYRFAKALLRNGDGAGARYDEPFGWRFEIVPETDPTSQTPLRLRLIYEGKPLAGTLVTAMHRDDPNARVQLRSDKQGRVTLNLPKNGVWLVKAVQMVAAPAGSNADWESMWASLTFER